MRVSAAGGRGGSRPARPNQSRGGSATNPNRGGRGVALPGGSGGEKRGRVSGRELNKEDKAVLEDANARTLSAAKATAQRARRLAADAQHSSGSGAAGVRPFWQVAEEWNEGSARDAEGGDGDDGPSTGKGGTRRRGAKRAVQHDLLQAHRVAFEAALAAELAEEWKASEERLTLWPRQRLMEEGVALFGLEASPDGTLFQDVIMRFSVGGPGAGGRGGTPLPYHTFSHGDVVLISSPSAADSVEGVVMDYSTRWLRVAVPDDAARHLRGGPWRLDQYGNTTAHDRCMAALGEFSRPISASDNQYAPLRRLLLGCGMPAAERMAAAAQLPAWGRGSKGIERRKEAVAKLRDSSSGLNPSQLAAVESALSQTLTLWQGPPGTGKTKTLLAFIAAAVEAGKGPVLATAASNVAVDGLLAGLLDRGIRVVRLGQPVKVLPELRRATLEALMESHPAGREAIQLRARSVGQDSMSGRLLREAAMKLEERAACEILDKAQVVAATCVAAGDPRLEGRTFCLCAIDEATQAPEPASLIPLLASCESAVFVGDPRQLPPTVLSREAVQAGMGMSLFERLQRAGHKPHLLDMQYRMHPLIAQFPSAAFYSSRLKSVPTPEERAAPPGFPWPRGGLPVAFVEARGLEERTTVGEDAAPSYFNQREAGLVGAIVSRLLLTGAVPQGPAGIGIITPYSGQVREIRRVLPALAGKGRPLLEKLEVNSVDGFQGREKEVIIFSAVRANPQGSVGFLADARRLNVAITRARRGLIVLGDRQTLSSDPVWRAYLAWVNHHQLAISGDLILPRGEGDGYDRVIAADCKTQEKSLDDGYVGGVASLGPGKEQRRPGKSGDGLGRLVNALDKLSQ